MHLKERHKNIYITKSFVLVPSSKKKKSFNTIFKLFLFLYHDSRLTVWTVISGMLLINSSKQNIKMILNFFKRQSWIDKRLAFKDSTNNITTLALSISMLKKIWKPDTFFFNGKQVKFPIQILKRILIT